MLACVCKWVWFLLTAWISVELFTAHRPRFGSIVGCTGFLVCYATCRTLWFFGGETCVCVRVRAFVRALCSLALCNVMFTVYRGNISFLFYRFCWMILVLLLLLIRLPLLLLLLRSILFGARQRFVFGWKNQMRFGWWCLANNKSVLRRTPYDFPAMHHTSKNVQFFFSCFHRLFWW